MEFFLYNDFGEVFCVTEDASIAYTEALDYLKKKADDDNQYLKWLMELKVHFNKNPNSYGVFGLLWVEQERKKFGK